MKMLRCGARRPRLVERPFELHRPDQQPRHVAAVGVLAADADLANAGEVVDVVLLDIRAGELSIAPSNTKRASFVARHGLRRPTGANVLPQSRRRPRCTPSRGARFSKREKRLRKFTARQRAE